MKYYSFSAKEMSKDHYFRWLDITKSDRLLSNPYFHPEFTRVMSKVRNDVYVGIIENDQGEIIGFLPYQCSRGGLARPVGLGLSDYHGLIILSQFDTPANEILKGFGIKRWSFDHLLAEQKSFIGFHENLYESPIIDISRGFENYEENFNKKAKKQYKETLRKQKKLEDEIGPLKFSLHTKSNEILQTLIQWKSEQCRRTGTIDYFSIEWCRNLIQELHLLKKDDFGGILSCLFAGDKIAAIHFGMYTQAVWHSWFPTYNHELEKYSPGSILLYLIIKEASTSGVNYIDLGKGMSLYKKRVMTGSITVADGYVSIPSLLNNLINVGQTIEQWGKKPLLKPVFKIPMALINSKKRWARYK